MMRVGNHLAFAEHRAQKGSASVALPDKIARDWSDGANHGHMWGAKLVAVKHRAVEGAWKVVDTAMDLAGGYGIFKQTLIERLFRDARLGRIHPANAFLTREFVAKTVLGISIDETPRWG